MMLPRLNAFRRDAIIFRSSEKHASWSPSPPFAFTGPVTSLVSHFSANPPFFRSPDAPQLIDTWRTPQYSK